MAGINVKKIILFVLLVFFMIICARFVVYCYFNVFLLLFYLSLICFCFSSVLIIFYFYKPGLLLFISIMALVFSILLPIVDFIYLNYQAYNPTKTDKIVYSYEEAQGNPLAFKQWWNYVVYEWTRGPKKNIEQPDPQGILPFVYKPNSETKFFWSTIRINNLGFRGSDIAVDKGQAYRIFAVGESTTFGATINPGDRPWPEVLQELVNRLNLARPVEIINAGTPGYNLKDNLERLRRDILPLSPDLIISYHGFNGIKYFGLDLFSIVRVSPERGSRILGDVEDRLRNFREQQVATERNIPPPRPLQALLASQYAEFYRQLLQMGRTHNFVVALAPFNMAVTRESPEEVIDFYAGGFPGVRIAIPAIEDHNVLVAALAPSEGALFWDIRPGINGAYNSDIFTDLVHFTQKGRDLVAMAVFQKLKPFLIATLGTTSGAGEAVDPNGNENIIKGCQVR